MIIFIILILISSAIFFVLLEQKKSQQEKDRQRNDWNEQEKQKIEQQKQDQQQRERQNNDWNEQEKQRVEQQKQDQQQRERHKKIVNENLDREQRGRHKGIIDALVVEKYDRFARRVTMGNLIPLKLCGCQSSYVQCMYVQCHVDSYSKKTILSIGIIRPDHEGDYLHVDSIRIPANNKYYALKKISKIVRKYHIDIGKKIVYLDKAIDMIEELKRFISSSEYAQPNRMFPENSSEIYDLNSEYKDLHQKYNLLIFNVMKGDELIGYTADNFPDISASVATLDREHNELTKRFKSIKKELNTYPKLKIDLESLGYYEGRYEY